MEISIIIPMFNSKNYIGRCLKSIKDQSYNNYEVILIDDFSSDNSSRVAENLLEQYKISGTVIRNESNLGPGLSRNQGLKHCHGKYILFIDSDDWISPNCLNVLHDKIISENADIVFCDYLKVWENGKIQECKDLNLEEGMIDNILYASLCNDGVTRKLIKRSIFNENHILFPDWNNGEDIYVTILLALNCRKIYYINEYLYNYFQRLDSTSNADIKNLNFYMDIYDLFEAEYNRRKFDKKYLYNRLISDLFYNNVLVMLKTGKSKKDISKYLKNISNRYNSTYDDIDLSYYSSTKKAFIKASMKNCVILINLMYRVKLIMERNR